MVSNCVQFPTNMTSLFFMVEKHFVINIYHIFFTHSSLVRYVKEIFPLLGMSLSFPHAVSNTPPPPLHSTLSVSFPTHLIHTSLKSKKKKTGFTVTSTYSTLLELSSPCKEAETEAVNSKRTSSLFSSTHCPRIQPSLLPVTCLKPVSLLSSIKTILISQIMHVFRSK